MKKAPSYMAWSVWTLGVLFLFYKFFIQNFLAVMSNDLMSAFAIGALKLGALSSVFYISYSFMQVPIGMLMDKFGARSLLGIAALLTALGCFVFSTTTSYGLALASRAFMGVGCSFGFIGMAYISSHWFCKSRLPFLLGLGNSVGMLGSVFAQGPLSFLLEAISWPRAVFAFGVFGVLLGVGILVILRKGKRVPANTQDKEIPLAKAIKLVFLNPWTWLNALVALLFYTTTTGFAGLWGIPFLENVYGLDPNVAAWASSMVFIGWIAGGPLIGMMADSLHARKKLQLVTIFLTFLCMVLIIYVPSLPIVVLFSLMLLVGVFSSAQLLSFALAVESVPFKAKGTSMAMTNCIVSFGSFAVQPIVGWVIEWASGGTKSSTANYTHYAYKMGMSVFLVSLALSFILLLFFKEHHKRKLEAETRWNRVPGD